MSKHPLIGVFFLAGMATVSLGGWAATFDTTLEDDLPRIYTSGTCPFSQSVEACILDHGDDVLVVPTGHNGFSVAGCRHTRDVLISHGRPWLALVSLPKWCRRLAEEVGSEYSDGPWPTFWVDGKEAESGLKIEGFPAVGSSCRPAEAVELYRASRGEH